MKTPRLLFSSLLARGLLGTLALPFARAASQYDQRLANLSTRGQVGSGANVMITGFVVNEGAPKKMLIRAIGQRLGQAPFNVAGVLSNPTLSLYNSNNQLVLQNDNWNSSDNDQTALAAASTAVGAFSLTGANSDSALIATLSPGAYTAVVSGVNNGVGVGLLEVYDISGSARLTNLSTRAVINPGGPGAAGGVLISGLVIATGGGPRHLLIRAAGPALTALGVPGAIADPVFSIYSGTTIIANGSSTNWDSTSAAGTISAATAQAGAFPFPAGSKDDAMVIDLTPGAYTIQVGGVGGVGGVSLVEVYDLTSESLSTVSVTASVASTDTQGAAPGVFTFTRNGKIDTAINVAYTLGGTAVSGTDFQPLAGVVSFAAGVSSVTVSLTPKANAANVNNRIATLSLVANNSYGVGASDTASVAIYFNSGSLYVSNLRTPRTITGSTAYGTGTIQLSADETSAFVNVSFSNLSSPEVVAHLSIDGNYVFNLPQGQVSNAFWTFAPVGIYSTADLIAALKAGRITISIDTASFPTGELAGSYLKTTGSAAFNAPAAPPAINLSTVGAPDAARFLTQATFGPRGDEILALAAKGYTTWLNEQMALPASLHFPAANADMAAFGGGNTGPNRISSTNYQHAWWALATGAPDQLRQRVAFALSEIFVTSDQNDEISQWMDGHAVFYDLLVQGAFGNYRDLLEKVTLSADMGIYLSMMRNSKATYDSKGVLLSQPNENYAREIMQLFTIGLNELQPDGTLKLDPTGQPIPTYSQQTVVETAQVFTGWSYFQSGTNPAFRNGSNGSEGYINPMMLFPTSHDDSTKIIVGDKVLPASQGAVKDLKDTLDALFNHANTGPFIANQLIQRLVTSNPSPGYVYRVAQVFANNGAGVRGDLGAVIRAILLDYEARSSAIINTPSYGKAKEPLLRTTALLRAFYGSSNSGRYVTGALLNPEGLSNNNGSLSEAAGRAPTVFNFYEPGYVHPGAIAAAGLYAPEFQIFNDTTAISMPNYLYNLIVATRGTTEVGLVYTDVLPLAKTPRQLVDYMNLVLSAGSMPQTMIDRITTAITAMPTSTSDTDKVRSAIYLTVTSAEAATQK